MLFDALELVQKMSFFLNIGPACVNILAPSLPFTLLTACTTTVTIGMVGLLLPTYNVRELVLKYQPMIVFLSCSDPRNQY